jgi:uncharacterized protein YjbI with pentapeptide repeats
VNGYLVGEQANLTAANLSGADLAGYRLDGANLTSADLTSADLQGAVLSGGKLTLANLTSANLTDTELSSADLSGTNLTGAALAGADPTQATSGNITGTPASLPTNWILAGGYLVGPAADLNRAFLGNTDLAGADLAGATLENATLYGANLAAASLSDADAQDVDFTNANLTGADITGASMDGATWSNTTCPDGTISEQHAPDSCVTPLDTQPPVAAPAVAVGSAGADGWYHSKVIVAWNWTDNGTIDQTKCTQATASSAQGAAVKVSASCTDRNGNTGHASDQVKIDTTPPAVSVTGVASGQQYITGGVPQAGCTTTDGLSGVATEATVKVSTTGTHGVGPFTATCSGATDVAGNPAAAISVAYSAVYGLGGFLAPAQGATLAKSARTITVRYRLANSAGQPLSSAVAAALASAGDAQVSLTGPGITKKTAACAWKSAGQDFLCTIRTPTGARTGAANKYSVTALENVGTGLRTAPAVKAAVDPLTIHFK